MGPSTRTTDTTSTTTFCSIHPSTLAIGDHLSPIQTPRRKKASKQASKLPFVWRSVDLFFFAMAAAAAEVNYLYEFVEEADLYNSIVLGHLLPGDNWKTLPRPVRILLRNYIAATALYFLSCFVAAFYAYHLRRRLSTPKDRVPTTKAMLQQIYVSMKAMPSYALLATLSDYMVENGWTRCYSSVAEVGWPLYFSHLGIYMVTCEVLLYWVHRSLHEIKILYRYIHAPHHAYNKGDTISPFAGFALHPLDAVLEGSPFLVALFVVPIQFRAHNVILFSETFWTANVHEENGFIPREAWPVMGAEHHTIHHVTYRHNYGLHTTFMDWAFGTLKNPKPNRPSFKATTL